MAVMSVVALQVKPGRYEDFLEMQRQAQSILADCGAKNQRLIAALSAGPASGTVVATWEADNWEEYGKVTGAFFGSEKGIGMMMESNAEDSPISGWESSVYTDVPL